MNFQSVCRLCLHPNELMCPLHECLIDESESVRVVDFLEDYTKLNIDFDDDEPNQICLNCLMEIQRIHSFMIKCEKTEEALRQLKDAQGQLNKLKEIEIYPEDSDVSEDIIEIQEEKITEWSGYAPISETLIQSKEASKGSEQIVITPDVICLDEESDDPSESSIMNAEESDSKNMSYEENLEMLDADSSTGHKRKRSRTGDDFIPQTKTCNICKRVFKHKKNLKRHILTVHSTVDLSIQCDICLRTYRNKDSLRSHTLSAHSNEKAVRKGSIKLRCPICSKQFEHMQSYKVHFQSHNEFLCEYCSKAFRRPSELMDHLDSSERGEYHCEICSRVFDRNLCLRAHKEHHMKKIDLQCKICSKFFSSKTVLKNHLEAVHGIDPLRCTVCSKLFRNKYSLGYHIRATHPNLAAIVSS